MKWLRKKLEYYDKIYENGSVKVLSIVLFFIFVIALNVFFAMFFSYNKVYEMTIYNLTVVFVTSYTLNLIFLKYEYLRAQYIMVFLLCIYVVWMTYFLGFDKRAYIVFYPLIFAYFTLSPVDIKHLTRSAIFTGIAFLISIIMNFTVESKYEDTLSSIEYVNVTIGVAGTYFVMISGTISERILRKNNKQEIDELEEMANRDFLTGLYNKRFIEKKVMNLDLNESYLVLADVDFFKKINDTYGHSTGDYTLKEVAELMKSKFRSQDFLIRWGGEEFMIIINDVNFDQTIRKIKVFKDSLSEKNFEYEKFNFKINMTFGIHKIDNFISFEDNVRKADEALYYGKQNGRNSIIIKNEEGEFIKK